MPPITVAATTPLANRWNYVSATELSPVHQLRRWYEQFHTDVADISEEMTARFEFEVDTTRAVTAWEAEVAENLAKRARG